MQINQNNTNYGGIGFLGALCLLLVALKLTGVITWSWWVVTAPLWVPWILLVAVFALTFFYLVGKDYSKRWRKKG